MVYLLFQWDLFHLEVQLPKNGCLWYLHILHHLRVVLVHNCSFMRFQLLLHMVQLISWVKNCQRWGWRGGRDDGLWDNKGGHLFNFISREELLKHIPKHTKQHLCEECHKSYASKNNWDAHIAKFHWGVTGVFHCTLPGCTVKMKTKGGFYKQYNRKHKCGFCNKIFAGVNKLEDHEWSTKFVPICKVCRRSSIQPRCARGT